MQCKPEKYAIQFAFGKGCAGPLLGFLEEKIWLNLSFIPHCKYNKFSTILSGWPQFSVLLDKVLLNLPLKVLLNLPLEAVEASCFELCPACFGHSQCVQGKLGHSVWNQYS